MSIVSSRRRWITSVAAVTVMVAGGVIATGTSASAATGCREVTATSIPLYYSSVGTVEAPERFYRGDVFRYTNTANSRYRTWIPRGVPESQGERRWARAAGSRGVACPF